MNPQFTYNPTFELNVLTEVKISPNDSNIGYSEFIRQTYWRRLWFFNQQYFNTIL